MICRFNSGTVPLSSSFWLIKKDKPEKVCKKEGAVKFSCLMFHVSQITTAKITCQSGIFDKIRIFDKTAYFPVLI